MHTWHVFQIANFTVTVFLSLLTLSYLGFFGIAEPGGGGCIGPPLHIPLILHPKLTKLGTIVDSDKVYFILVVKVLNWL